MQAKTMILIVVAVVCGLVATIGISQMVDGKGKTPQGETVKVFVAATNVDISDKLDSQNVRLEEWPRDRVPEGAITKLEDLQDRFAAQRLYPGEPIMKAKLMNDNAGSPTVHIPPGHRACPIKVQGGHNAGALLINPGDRVDVLVFVRKSSELSFTGTKTILRDIRVFSVGEQTSRATDEEGGRGSAQTVMLLVTPKQAEKLTLASELGSLRLVLRHPGEEPDEEDEYDEATSVDSLLNGDDSFTPRDADTKAQPTTGSLLDLLSQSNQATDNANNVTVIPVQPAVEVEHTIYIHGESGVRVFDFQKGGERPVERDMNPAPPNYGPGTVGGTPAGSAPFSQSSTGNQGSDSSGLPSFDDFSFGDAN